VSGVRGVDDKKGGEALESVCGITPLELANAAEVKFLVQHECKEGEGIQEHQPKSWGTQNPTANAHIPHVVSFGGRP